jgi:hypothetical protein
MTNHQKLFSCQYGSKLYGTQTPTSDVDLKHIVLPPLQSLLLGKKLENVFKKTNTARNVKNTADDVDEEFIPLQKFARHFLEGQTYALELAFALEGTHAGQQVFNAFALRPEVYGEDLMFARFVIELRERFLTSNIKSMMGYVVNQANLYSFKGERLNVARELQALLYELDSYYKDDGLSLDVIDAPAWAVHVQRLADKYPKYFRKDVYDIGGNRMRPCLVVLEKTLPLTNTLAHSIKVVDTIINKYGSRADSASAMNVDWKATMHALRIVDEGIDLLTNRKLTFPFEQSYVDKLLSIKRGEVNIDEVKNELTDKLDHLKTIETTTSLPQKTQELEEEFEAWLVTWLYKFYGLK